MANSIGSLAVQITGSSTGLSKALHDAEAAKDRKAIAKAVQDAWKNIILEGMK